MSTTPEGLFDVMEEPLKYLEKNVQVIATGSALSTTSTVQSGLGQSTAKFRNVETQSAPQTGAFTPTEKTDFIFFVNGHYVEHDAINIRQSGSDFYVFIDNANLDYPLDSTDEVIAWGKFKE